MPTHIEWTDETWNPVTGCSKVSQGCKNCYALREWPRLAANPKSVYFGRAFTDIAVHPERLDKPLRWGRPRIIFVNSMSDLFHRDVPTVFIDKVLGVAWLCAFLDKGHIFQVLTKRAHIMRDYFSDGTKDYAFDWANAAVEVARSMKWTVHGELLYDFIKQHNGRNPALWLGVSVEEQATADERIPLLLETPAAVRWVSAEPLLGPVDLTRVCVLNSSSLGRFIDATCGHRWDESIHTGGSKPLRTDPPDGPKLDWVVVGGESGPNARAMHPQWARSLRDQCADAGVPLLFKQWGEWVPRSACYHTFEDGRDCSDMDPGAQRWPCIRLTERGHNGRDLAHAGEGDDAYMQRVGKTMAGRLLDGVLHDGYPPGA